MSTKLIGFQYHTTAVGNKSSSIFLNRIAKCFWRYGSGADPLGCFRPFSGGVLRGAFAADDAVAVKSPKLPLKNETDARRSGGIAKPPVELSHCGCGKLLVVGRKVFTIAAYLPATHLERFWIAHIARMQDV